MSVLSAPFLPSHAPCPHPYPPLAPFPNPMAAMAQSFSIPGGSQHMATDGPSLLPCNKQLFRTSG